MKPEFITNQNGNTLLAAVDAAIPDADSCAEIRIATAFMSPAGFGAVADRLERADRVYLLLGAEPEPEARRVYRKPGDPPQAAFERREVQEGLKLLEAGIRRERDRLPFTAAARRHLHRMVDLFRSGRLETRRYEDGFLHAKALIVDDGHPGVIAGSSNLTVAGLRHNLELNLGRWDPAVHAEAGAWFDALWAEAVPFDLAALLEEPEAEYPPWLIFMRVLWQLYGEELEEERREVGDIPLTAFQLHGVWRARRILKDFGGVVIADEVGLGKTFIGGAILDACAKNRQRALLVCPAALRRTWNSFLTNHGIGRFVEMVSYDELALDRQLCDDRRPRADRHNLTFDIDDYALVVIDEAHNYRNPDAPYRAAALRKLLFGQRKDVVLMTATPVNNTVWDFYNLMQYFVRQDSALANRGVVRIRERFKIASKQDPASLSPDYLYPIIDAITVKRTRGFVKKYYADSAIKGPDGVLRPVVFPKAVPISVRYDIDRLAPGLFDAVADALDPLNGTNPIAFARYGVEGYRLTTDDEEVEAAETASGLLRSGLLKRFESSAHAFRLSLGRMIDEHTLFLEALDKGKVITTSFFKELADDDDTFEELLETSGETEDASDFDVDALRAAVENDLDILRDLHERLAAVRDDDDPKLDAVVEELVKIIVEAQHDAATDEDERRNRKVLLFSYFTDTVEWLRSALDRRLASDQRLKACRTRLVAVAGQGVEGEDVGRMEAVYGFAPMTTDAPPNQEDLFDLLIATDVLAEGMNLQQCRNIINYDMPWNPMRLVQRHGRIDRIGSPHPRVFLRTVFPADRLDQLLALETRILRKLAQAAKTIGVATLPLDGAEVGDQVFAETRAEIERLADEDPTLFEQGGTAGAAQSGEEYRQRLRAALQSDRDAILGLPAAAGSGFRGGKVSGVMFCAEVELASGTRTFLRFVPADGNWTPQTDEGQVIRETGTCLRIVDCTEETPRELPDELGEGVFEFWDVAREDIMAEWDDLSDPANLQPPVRPLNREVAAFIRANVPHDVDADKLKEALDILEAPWPRREEALLRQHFRSREHVGRAKSQTLINWILSTGLERAVPPDPLPPIREEDVCLICWMAVDASVCTA